MVRETGGKLPGQKRDKGDQSQPADSWVTHTQHQKRPRQNRAKADTEIIPGPAPRAWLGRWTDARPAAQTGIPGRAASQREQGPARSQRPYCDRYTADNVDEYGHRNSSQWPVPQSNLTSVGRKKGLLRK